MFEGGLRGREDGRSVLTGVVRSLRQEGVAFLGAPNTTQKKLRLAEMPYTIYTYIEDYCCANILTGGCVSTVEVRQKINPTRFQTSAALYRSPLLRFGQMCSLVDSATYL